MKTGHAGLIQNMAFSPSGRLLATWSAEGTLIVWNAESFQEYMRIPIAPTFGMPSLILGEHRLLIADNSGVAEYPLSRNTRKRLLARGSIVDFSVSRDGEWLAHTDDDRSVHLVSIKTGQDLIIQASRENEEYGAELAFSSDSSQLLVSRPDGLISVYSVNQAVPQMILQIATQLRPDTVGFDRSGRAWIFETSNRSRNPREIRYATIRPGEEVPSAPEIRNVSIDFNVSGSRFIGDSQSLVLMGRQDDGESGWGDASHSLASELRIIAPPTPSPSPGIFFAAPAAFALADNGSKLATGDYLGQMAIWDVTKHVRSLIPASTIEPVKRIELTENAALMVAAHQNGPTDIWNLTTGERIAGLPYIPNEVALAARHSWLAFFSSKRELIVFNPLTGNTEKPGLIIKGRPGKIRLVDNDTKVIWLEGVEGEHPTLNIWNLETKYPPRILCHIQSTFVPLEVSRSTRNISTLCSSQEHLPPREILRNGVYVWTLPDLKPKLIDHGNVTAISFSPDDKFLVLAGSDIESVNLKTNSRYIWDSSNFTRNISSLTFSTDGARVYVGRNLGGSGVEVWYQWQTASRHKSIVFGQALSVASLAAGKNGDLWVGADDGTVSLLRGAKMRPIVKLVSLINAGWAAVTPGGLFDGNADAIGWIGWRRQKESTLTTADTFFDSFYHPGLVTEIANGKNPTPHGETIANLLNLPGLDYLLEIHLASLGDQDGSFGLCLPSIPSTNLLEQVDFRYKGNPENLKDMKVIEREEPDCKYFVHLPGDLKKYEINSKTAKAASPIVIRKPYPPGISPTRNMTVHIQTVTFNQYEVFDSLRFTSSDGSAFSEFFLKDAFPSEAEGGPHVELWPELKDGASLKDIRDRLSEIGRKSKPEDMVLLFFSGHGTVLPGQQMYFFLPNSVPAKDKDTIRARSLNSAMLADALRGMNANRILLVLDSCQSGGALDSLRKVADVKTELHARRAQGLNDVNIGSGIAIIAASSPFEQAVEQERLGFGFLAKALLDALRSDSRDVHDLMKHLVGHMHELSKGSKRIQNPEVFLSGDDFLLRTKNK